MAPRRPVELLIIALLSTACAAPEMEEGSPGGEDPAAPGEETPDGEGEDPAEALALQPHYIMELDSSVVVKDTASQEESTLRTLAGAVVDVNQSGSQVQLDVKMCYAIPPEIEGEQPRIPDAVVASVPPFQVQGRLDGSALSLDDAALVLGARLDAPLSDALPTSGSDPRVLDQDNDGQPGITIHYPSVLGTIDIYAAARFQFSVAANISDPMSFSGEGSAELATAVFGDNSVIVDVKQLVEDAASSTEVVSEAHLVEMRGSSVAVSCSDL